MGEKKKKKLLLVDDDPKYTAKLKAYLERNGYEVDSVSQLAEMIPRMKATEPDMVFLDADMPGVEEACPEIKKDPQICLTKVILLTYEKKDNIHSYYRKIGASGFVSRVLMPDVLATADQFLREMDLDEDEKYGKA